ncbi:MAG: porin family protein, partial [Ignavibacteria bacterium]|nr:porin family protein [Ignavibacteria bacterium]
MKTCFSILALLIATSTTTRAQLTYGSEVTGNLMIPTSSFSDAFKTGYGGTLGMFFDMQDNLRVTLSGGYLSSGVKESGVQSMYEQAGGTGTISPTGSVKTIPLLLGLQLITPGPMRIYGALEAGIYIYRVDVSATITDNTGSSNVRLADETRTEFGVNAGFGALFPLKDDLSATAGVKYHFVQTSDFR